MDNSTQMEQNISSMIKELIKLNLDCGIQNITRFTTGYTHMVYHVFTDRNEDFIVRLTPPENKHYYDGALYWLRKVEPLNLPFPKILFHGIKDEYPFMILNYIPGNDLNHVYPTLSDLEKSDIAKALVEIQSKIETLPRANGFGELSSYEKPCNLFISWNDCMQDMVDSCIKFMKESKLFRLTDYVEVIRTLNLSFQTYYNTIEPKPYLDDATTKNVLIDHGHLGGIVDLDWLCFGDKLLPTALTKASLLSSGYDCKYTDYWTQELSLSDQQKAALEFYSALYCLIFMREIGQTFANGKEVKASSEKIKRLEDAFKNLLAKIAV